MPATTAMTVFLAKDRHGGGDCDVLLNPGGEPLRHGVAAGGAVPGWGRTVLLGFVLLLRRHRRIVTGGERGSA